MTTQVITTAALAKMVELEGLIAARRQATWQKFKAAGENKAIWFRVIDTQNQRIKALQLEIKRCLGLPEFKAKRGWGT